MSTTSVLPINKNNMSYQSTIVFAFAINENYYLYGQNKNKLCQCTTNVGVNMRFVPFLAFDNQQSFMYILIREHAHNSGVQTEFN